MANEFLMMDKQDKCFHCPECDAMEAPLERWYCRRKSKEIEDIDSKPDWCPLIPEPKKFVNIYGEKMLKDCKGKGVVPAFGIGYAEGWNACIDALEGIKNDRKNTFKN